MTAGTDEFLTARAEQLILRSVVTPGREQPVARGEPLLVTVRLPEGFVEVDYAGQCWFAAAQSLQPWGAAAHPPVAGGRPSPAERAAAQTPRPGLMDAPPNGTSFAAGSPGDHAGGRAALRVVTGGHRRVRSRGRGRSPSRGRMLALALGSLAMVALGVAALALTGLWKTPAGWVLCEGGARVVSFERLDSDTALIICDGWEPLRRPFRKYSAVATPPRSHFALGWAFSPGDEAARVTIEPAHGASVTSRRQGIASGRSALERDVTSVRGYGTWASGLPDAVRPVGASPV